MKRKILSTILAFTLFICIFPQTGLATDSDERAKAVDYVTANNIFVGDQNGNLNLESGLTRAELATLLARINKDEQSVKNNEAQYSAYCKFMDVPVWAQPYVGYCVNKGLMVGYSDTTFGADDPVNPQAACTVMLRYLGYAETDWNYNTSVAKARAAGIAASSGLDGTTINRGTMAVLIHKSLVPAGNSRGNAVANPTDWGFQLNASLVALQSYTIEDELYIRLWEMCRWLDVYVGMEQSTVVIDFEKPYTGVKVYYQSKTTATAIPSTHTLQVNGDVSQLETYLVNDEVFISVEDIATWKGVLAVPDEKHSNLYLIDMGKRMVVGNSDIAARDADRAEVIRLVNEERVRVGVAPLEVLPSLMECAQIKAEDMFVNEYYSHISPTYGSSFEMIRALVPEPIAVSGENIAMTRPTPQRVFEAWMDSPGHYAAMIDPDWTHVGVGAAKLEGYGYLYWALQFVALQK